MTAHNPTRLPPLRPPPPTDAAQAADDIRADVEPWASRFPMHAPAAHCWQITFDDGSVLEITAYPPPAQ